MTSKTNKYSKNVKTLPYPELYGHRRCASYVFSCYRRPRIIKGRLTQMVRKVLGVIDDNHAIAPSKHSIPSFSSISATLLKEKLTFPERMRLTY